MIFYDFKLEWQKLIEEEFTCDIILGALEAIDSLEKPESYMLRSKNLVLKTFKSVHRIGEGYRCEFRDRGCYYEVDKKSSMDLHYQRCHMRKCHICNLSIATFDFEAHTQKHLDEVDRQNAAVINLIY